MVGCSAKICDSTCYLLMGVGSPVVRVAEWHCDGQRLGCDADRYDVVLPLAGSVYSVFFW